MAKTSNDDLMPKLLLLIVLMFGACSPIFGVGSFVHSVISGNTVGIITGGAGVAVEETTGKSVTEHVIDGINPPAKKIKQEKSQGVTWSYENFSKVLNED